MTRHHAKKAKARNHDIHRARGELDGAVYIGFALIGIFAVGLWYLVDDTTWRHGLIGYVVAVAVLINLYALRACQGRSLAMWQAALARVSLRWVGYGVRGGKPLEAAKGSNRALTMLLVSVAAAAVLVTLLTVFLIPSGGP